MTQQTVQPPVSQWCASITKRDHHYPPAGYDGDRPKGTNLIGLQKAANELGFTTAAVRVDRENFLSDFSLPCIAQVINDRGMGHFVVVFKKTTIKDDDTRRKHILTENEKNRMIPSISPGIMSSSATPLPS